MQPAALSTLSGKITEAVRRSTPSSTIPEALSFVTGEFSSFAQKIEGIHSLSTV